MFAKEVTEAKCFVCHVAGKTKEERNSYGKELAKAIKPADWDASKKYPGETDKAKIAEALKKSRRHPRRPERSEVAHLWRFNQERKIARRRREIAAR